MSKLHWLAFSKLSGVGGATARCLLERFGTIEAAWDAPDEEWSEIPRVTPKIAAGRRTICLDALENELALLADEGLRVVTWEDDDYPANLRPVGDAPPLLFVRGTLQFEDDRSVAIVGTRQPSLKGIQCAEALARGLAERGVTIVSGLAPGIDTAAHRGALQAVGGRTLAVPGSGLRAIYPPENIPLAAEIADRGALLSEIRPDIVVHRQNLWARNRIVSGLSRAVIVVEAAERSGSLSTAEGARRQGRLVFAIPGSPGTDALLAAGAEALDPGDPDLDALSARLPGGYLLLSPRPGAQNSQTQLAFADGE